jgi:hypothetical protein
MDGHLTYNTQLEKKTTGQGMNCWDIPIKPGVRFHINKTNNNNFFKSTNFYKF